MKNVVKMVVGLVVVVGLATVGYVNVRNMNRGVDNVKQQLTQLAEEMTDKLDEVNNGEVKKVDNKMDIMELREYIREFWNKK